MSWKPILTAAIIALAAVAVANRVAFLRDLINPARPA